MKYVPSDVQERFRIAIGVAIIQSGWLDSAKTPDEYGLESISYPDSLDLLQFHPCGGPYCKETWKCGCAGLPYLSDMVWDKINCFGDFTKALELFLNYALDEAQKLPSEEILDTVMPIERIEFVGTEHTSNMVSGEEFLNKLEKIEKIEKTLNSQDEPY